MSEMLNQNRRQTDDTALDERLTSLLEAAAAPTEPAPRPEPVPPPEPPARPADFPANPLASDPTAGNAQQTFGPTTDRVNHRSHVSGSTSFALRRPNGSADSVALKSLLGCSVRLAA